MNEQQAERTEMNALQKLTGIFTDPGKTYEAVNKKPSWIVPLILMIVTIAAIQFFILDISLADRIKIMEARGMDPAQMDMAQQQMQGPMKYLGFVFGPLFVALSWMVIAGVLLFAGNVIMGGQAKFKPVLAVVAWSYPISLLGGILKTFLIISKETTLGITTSLAAFLPAPDIGTSGSMLYKILSKFDIFTIWQVVLWAIGLSVVYKVSTKKSGTVVGVEWGVWVILSVAVGSLIKF